MFGVCGFNGFARKWVKCVFFNLEDVVGWCLAHLLLRLKAEQTVLLKASGLVCLLVVTAVQLCKLCFGDAFVYRSLLGFCVIYTGGD